MSEWQSYLLGQIAHEQKEASNKLDHISSDIDTLTGKVDEALTWAQRLVWMGLSLLGAVGLNWSPDKIGELLAAIMRARL